jgi:L-amino acid N-acyltransferase YncA
MGAVGILQVKDEHKSKGFGSLLVKAFAKQTTKELSVDITAHILSDNVISKKLFMQLGFRKVQENAWLGLKGVNAE